MLLTSVLKDNDSEQFNSQMLQYQKPSKTVNKLYFQLHSKLQQAK